MKNSGRFFFLIVVFTIFTVSCIKEGDFDFKHITITENFSYDLALPLVDANMSLGDMLKSVQMAQTDSTGLLHLIYEDEFSYTFSDLALEIPDQNFHVTSPSKIPVPPGSLMPDSIVITYSDSIFFHIADNNMRMDSIFLETGLIVMNIQTDIRNRIKLEISNPNIISADNKALVLATEFKGVTSGGQTAYADSDLSKYGIKPIYDELNNEHLLSWDYKVTVYKDDNVLTPYLGELSISAGITNLTPDIVYGYFEKETYGPETGEIDLKILNRFSIQALELEKAKMQMKVYNGIGIPVFMVGTVSTHTENINNPIKSMNIRADLPYPKSRYEDYRDTTFEENFQDLINDNDGFLPTKLSYSAIITSNPDEDNNITNMLRKNDGFKVSIRADLPMRLRVSDLEMADTFNFEGLPQAEGVEFFILKANVHNGFPLDASAKLYFLDEFYQTVDSVEMPEFKGAPVDPNSGHILRQAVSQIDINLNQSQIEHLVDTRYFLIKGNLSSTNDGTEMVSIYEDENYEGHIKIMIGARIKATAEVIAKIGGINLVF